MKQTASKDIIKIASIFLLVAFGILSSASGQTENVLVSARADADRLFQLSPAKLTAKVEEALVAANKPNSTLYQVALAAYLRDEIRWVSNDPPAYLNERVKLLDHALARFKLGTDDESRRLLILGRDETWGNKKMMASSKALSLKYPSDTALLRSAAEIAIGYGSTSDIEWAFGVTSKLWETHPKTASYARLRGLAATGLGNRKPAEKRKYFETALSSYNRFLSLASKNHPSRRLVEKFVKQLEDWLAKNG